MKVRLKLFWSLLAIGSSAGAQSSTVDALARDIDVSLQFSAETISVELCPNSVCDLFVASSLDLDSVLEFVDLYVVFASHYGDLRTFGRRDDSVINPIPYIVTRLEDIDDTEILYPQCGDAVTAESIACGLQSLAQTLSIEKFSVREVEGIEQQQKDDAWVAEELSSRNVQSALQWYSSLGLVGPIRQ